MRTEIFFGPIPEGKSWHSQLPNPEFDKIFESLKALPNGGCLRTECENPKEAGKLCSGLRHRAKKFSTPIRTVIRGKDVYSYLDK